jgi:UDP-GlcNAc:undecaprenyl-phosphate GlcNAc-1-phosphate transferase
LALAAAFVAIEAMIAVFCPEARLHTPARPVLLLGSLAMFALGFRDDFKPLGAKRKLLGQVLIALAVAAFGISIQHFKIPFTSTILDLGGWGVVLTVVWLVGMTNLINLIDGADGLAGGISLMLMILLTFVSYQSGNLELLAPGMAGALFAFLWFNFPPARVYLGDGGAYFLGFQIGLFSILNSHKGTVFAALAAPLFVLALPILDTSLAILRRGLRGLPIFRADRRHLHHHLLTMGMSRRRVVIFFYGLTAIFLTLGLVAYWSRGKLIPVLLGVGTLILLLCAARFRFSRGWFDVGRMVGTSLEMRQEIAYALSLTRWLTLEGGRCRSTEEIWSGLVFAAERLGYCSVKVTLADGKRVWERANVCSAPGAGPGYAHPTRAIVQSLHGGRLGILELIAPACAASPNPLAPPSQCQKSFCPCIGDDNVAEIVSELLAEGWVKAVTQLQHGDHTPLRFDTTRAASKRPSQHPFPLPHARVPQPAPDPPKSAAK